MDLKKSIALLISTYFLLGSSLIIDGNELMNIIEDNGIPFKDFFDYMDDNGLYYEFKEDDPINIYGLSTKDEELNNDNSDSEEEEELDPEAPCSSSQVIAVKKKKASNICQFEDCNIRGSFGYLDKKEKYCLKHKQPGMIDKENKLCFKDGCTKRAQYGFNKNELYCNVHRDLNMINQLSKKCSYKGCLTQPIFGFNKKQLFCKNHKQPGMTDQRNKTKICKHKNCTKRGTFGFNTKDLFCIDHKEQNMTDQMNRKCKYSGCLKQPFYGFDKKNLFCAVHRKPGMTDQFNKLCIECNITYPNPDPKYESHCVYCFINKYPNNTISKNYKVKEKHVIDFIENNFPNQFTYGLTIKGGCSRKMPDMFRDCLTHSIIVEVDEEQHRSYLCENKRMMLLFQDLAKRPTVFIRFNPDSYIDKNCKKINSCFKIHKSNGMLILKNKEDWDNRLKKLNNRIQYYINNIPEKEVTIEYLFYNE